MHKKIRLFISTLYNSEKSFTRNYETLYSENINVVFNNSMVDKSLNMQINVKNKALKPFIKST